MTYVLRKISPSIRHGLERGKSILLLGARQTGKTTLIQQEIKPDISYSFIQPETRLHYERNPSILAKEIASEIRIKNLINPVISIDEIQKVPLMMDVIQDLIDRKIARFILTGSSARKLKHGPSINLLPGRVLLMQLDPLLLSEIKELPSIENLLLYGSLPGIFTEPSDIDKTKDLSSYVKTYLEEEIRAESIVRNLGHFSKFLYLAATESGNIINLSQLSQAIGVAHTTINKYFQILDDCLITEKIEPLTHGRTRNRLSKTPKYLFFDLGVRRLCAEEGTQLPPSVMGCLFEQYIGLELIRSFRLSDESIKIRYWRDHDGPEIDYVIEHNQNYIPIEIKWSEYPTEKDCRHLSLFLKEYSNAKQGYIICRTPKSYLLTENIMVLPWQAMADISIFLENL